MTEGLWFCCIGWIDHLPGTCCQIWCFIQGPFLWGKVYLNKKLLVVGIIWHVPADIIRIFQSKLTKPVHMYLFKVNNKDTRAASIPIPLEIVRKPELFCFQGVKKWTLFLYFYSSRRSNIQIHSFSNYLTIQCEKQYSFHTMWKW